MRLRTRLLLSCLALIVALPGRSDSEEAVLDKKARRGVASIALALARKGHADPYREVVEVLRRLGTPADEIVALEKKATKQLARAKKVRDPKAERKKLQALADTLAAGLADHDDARRRYHAEVVLRLDADQAVAREALGHVRHEGHWTPSDLVPLLRRRVEVEASVAKWRKAPFEIELGTSTEPSFVASYGKRGAVARHGGVEVHVARTGAQGARRILLQALRAWHLAAEVAGISSDLYPDAGLRIAFHGSFAEYRRSIRPAVTAGRLPANEAKTAVEHRTYRTRDGFLVSDSGVEAHHQTFVLFDIWYGHVRRRWEGEDPLPCLEAGLLNWVMLQMMGCPLPRINWRETQWEQRIGRTLTDEENRTRKHLLKLSQAGLAGTRAYMRFLMARRLDPPWANAFQDALGAVRGHDLLKCTVIHEHLLEADVLKKVLVGTLTTDASSVPATTKAMEAMLGLALSEYEDAVRAWMLHETKPGLVQRLAGTAPAQTASGPSPVPYLSAIRQRAYAPSNPITLEPGLTKGARAHARYLARHPKQAAAWPDAHEEYVDHELYSPEGARAGASSVIAPGSKTWKAAVDSWMGTYFHRLPLLDPGLLGVGAGLVDGMAVLDTGSLVDEWRARAYVAWPPKGEKDVPLRFAPELPHPVPGVAQSTLGYPVTLQIFADGGQPDIEMTLRAGGESVPCWFTAPHAPLNPELVPAGAYCLIPKAHLRPGTEYAVRVEKILQQDRDGRPETTSLSWSFRTRR